MGDRFIGIDLGAETVKVAEVAREGGALRWTRRLRVEHRKDPAGALKRLLPQLDWEGLAGGAASGRFSRQLRLARIPIKAAQARALRHLHGGAPATVVSIGSHGFSVLELRDRGAEVFRENSRCSQGTGSFLRQLVERFGLDVEVASRLVEGVKDPSPLSGRCPVILKTDMTHLANKGEDRTGILAGLYDAVCENVQVLVKPDLGPPRVALIGGVARSRRVREHFRRYLERHGMCLLPDEGDDALYYEALGCALAAAERPGPLPGSDDLFAPAARDGLEMVPALADHLDRVKRMPARPLAPIDDRPRRLVLGLDIGSTGSKAVAMDAESREVVWEGYTETSGDPVGAAQSLVRRFAGAPAGRLPVLAFGVTGSGREIVGSLLITCYGEGATFVLNEIAAHATGALHHDPEVDTIFEIGGQDAKYIRLAGGRVVDAAMNEACSAGTGSFIEEQGRRFAGIENVVQMGEAALRARRGVSLGQHCSVFMAEVIDEAVADGVEQDAVIAGLYDSIIQNYLNRVKGPRSVGRVIFCQGMPFSAPALAAAVARQTGCRVVVPPGPGSVGALGIALLAGRDLPLEGREPCGMGRFLDARLEGKEAFVCKSTVGCGGSGNRCRIDRIRTMVAGERRRFTWGGACSLHDSGTGGRKLPDHAPDPFRTREELVREITEALANRRGGPRIALTDEFVLKGLFPFFATFLHGMGFDLAVHGGAGQAALKRGIERANVPYCAPMQQYYGLVGAMAEEGPDYLFLPMLRSLPRIGDEPNSVSCPIAQGSADLLRWDLGLEGGPRVLSPVIDTGPGNLESDAFRAGCEGLARELGVAGSRWRGAYQQALAVQQRFDERCLDLGREALAFCAERGVVPVVVLGRAYTIYNTVLNSNVPAILREQGALPVPVDCYPVDESLPVLEDVYWSYSQANLRAARQVRRAPGVYSLFCSNYACGPDSFNLHFYSYIMEGKPFAVIETDGHTGDAGTKTRVEAFLYCVREDLASEEQARPANSLQRVAETKARMPEVRRSGELLLVPGLSDSTRALAACIRKLGIQAEHLSLQGPEALRLGRRHTSGKECLPLCLTLGSFLGRIQADPDPERRFALLMPTSNGPCRFGVYNLLQKVVLERLEMGGRVRIFSPNDNSYFAEGGRGFGALVAAGMMAADMLSEALYQVRPVERVPGAAREIHRCRMVDLLQALESEDNGKISVARAILEARSGRLFGCGDVLRAAAEEYAAVKGPEDLPTVLVVGEIYVRCEPFANDFIIERLERRGIRVRFAPMSEWLEYVSDLSLERNGGGLGVRLARWIQRTIQERTYSLMGEALGWPPRTAVRDTMAAASPYLRPELQGEAVLTLGGPIHEWREGLIDGAVNVGPLECMPTKLAEAQFFHVAEREGLKTLTLSLNGEPVDPDIIDAFAYEVHEQFRRRREERAAAGAGG